MSIGKTNALVEGFTWIEDVVTSQSILQIPGPMLYNDAVLGLLDDVGLSLFVKCLKIV